MSDFQIVHEGCTFTFTSTKIRSRHAPGRDFSLIDIRKSVHLNLHFSLRYCNKYVKKTYIFPYLLQVSSAARSYGAQGAISSFSTLKFITFPYFKVNLKVFSLKTFIKF